MLNVGDMLLLKPLAAMSGAKRVYVFSWDPVVIPLTGCNDKHRAKVSSEETSPHALPPASCHPSPIGEETKIQLHRSRDVAESYLHLPFKSL